MTDKTSAPRYALRGLQLIGWRDMQHALDFLFADGQMKSGTLVAINAEKMLAVEDNADVKSLIERLNLNTRTESAWSALYVKNILTLMYLAWRVPISGSSLWPALVRRVRRCS